MAAGSETLNKQWQDAVIRAAAEASRLQPLATVLLAAAGLLALGHGVLQPLMDLATGLSPFEELSEGLIEVLPVAPLVWALWATRAYLGKLARGEVWGPATMGMLGRVGDALLWAAALSILVAPTLDDWARGDFGFEMELNASHLALAGLGLLLSLIARVMRNVVEVAAALKRESDEIV